MKTIGFLVTNLLELLKYKKSIIVTDAKRRNLSKNKYPISKRKICCKGIKFKRYDTF